MILTFYSSYLRKTPVQLFPEVLHIVAAVFPGTAILGDIYKGKGEAVLSNSNSMECGVWSMEKVLLTTVAGTVAVADSLPFKKNKQFCSCILFSKQSNRARTLLGISRS